MRNPQLKLMDLVLGLEYFGERYETIDVFADDVLAVQSAAPEDGLYALGQGGRCFRFTVPRGRSHEGKTYMIELFPREGIVQMSRAVSGAPSGPESPATEGLTGEAAVRAVSVARRERGEGADVGLILGLLTRAAPTGHAGSGKEGAPRGVFTLQFDPSLGQWRAYNGGLVPWMKKQLLARSA